MKRSHREDQKESSTSRETFENSISVRKPKTIVRQQAHKTNNVPEPRSNVSNGFKTRVKRRLNNYLFNDIYKHIGFTILEKFMTKYLVLVSRNFADYTNGVRSRRRRCIVYAIHMLDWFMIFRFILLAVINEPWILILFGDSFYIWGKSQFLFAMFGCFGFAIAALRLTYIILEENSALEPVKFLHQIKTNQLDVNLDDKYYSKFCLKAKFVAKYFLKPTLIGCAIIPVLTVFISSVVVYLDHELDHSIVALIICNIQIAIWIFHATALGWANFVLFYISSSYLKYQFRQINDEIAQSLNHRNSSSLIRAVEKHQINTELVGKFNQLFKWGFGLSYFGCTPAINILFYLGFQQDVNIFLRVVYLSVGVQIFFVIFALNLTASNFTATAHKSVKLLYPVIVEKNLRFYYKFKIYSFIEKLSGNSIAFYCVDLFPFNNYMFYQYVTIVVVNYFLVLKLKEDSQI